MYLQRKSPRDAYHHIFHRGPRFADYHLRPGGRYYRVWIGIWLTGLGITIGCVLNPNVLIPITISAFLLLILVSIWLSETPRDFVRIFAVLPLISLIFGLGILRGKIYQTKTALER